jgi:hypothetical protein
METESQLSVNLKSDQGFESTGIKEHPEPKYRFIELVSRSLYSAIIIVAFIAVFITFFLYISGMRSYHLNVKLNNSPDARNNTFCQQPNLTALDRSVCFDNRFSQLFFLYTDGTPLTYYADFGTSEKYGNMSVIFPMHHIGPQLSGPIFRAGVLGRPDADVIGQVSNVDNVFNQIRYSAKIDLGLFVNTNFPIRDALNEQNFARVHYDGNIPYEGFTTFCDRSTQFKLFNYKTTVDCPDLWDCIYDGKQAAQMVLNRRDELLKSFTKENKASNAKCLDRELEITPGGFALYLEQTDVKGHIYTATHKYMIELHATHRANLDLALDHIFHKYPDAVIALYSDHGHASSLADREWTSHGYQTAGNTGFLILLHRSFAGRTKKNSDIPEDSASMFLQFLSLLRGANFPMYSEDIPVAKFADDPDDRLRVLRLKEMQLQSLLGAEHFADSPLLSFLDSGLSLADNIARTDKSRMSLFLVEYEQYLRKKHPLYVQKMNSLLHSSFLLVQIGGLILGLATVALLPFLVRRLLQGKERVAVLVAFGMVLAWTGLKVLTVTEKGWYDTYISLSFLLPLTLFFRHLASLSPESQSVLGRVARQLPARDWQYLYWTAGMWTGVIAGVKLVFVVVMDWTHTSHTFLYFLSKPAGVMSAMVITLWTVVLVWMAWTSDSYDQTDNTSDKDEIDSSIKLRLQSFSSTQHEVGDKSS